PMPFPIVCECGARLEIDEKFAGQTIACPDCSRPLLTPVPPKPPAKTSGLALASFLCALIGAFTIVGTVAAMVCGVLALRGIKRAAEPLGGRNLARAGLILGGVFTLLSVAAFLSMERFGLDGLLRSLEMAGRIEYSNDPVSGESLNGRFTIDRPSP